MGNTLLLPSNCDILGTYKGNSFALAPLAPDHMAINQRQALRPLEPLGVTLGHLSPLTPLWASYRLASRASALHPIPWVTITIAHSSMITHAIKDIAINGK